MESPVLFYSSRTGRVGQDYADTARFNVPGGVVAPADWAQLAELARAHGDGHLYLAGQCSVELRSLSDVPALSAALSSCFLPCAPWPILASPLSPAARSLAVEVAQKLAKAGSAPGREDLAADARAAEQLGALCGIDAGGGDVLAQRPEVAVVLREGGAELIEGGRVSGTLLRTEDLAGQIARRVSAAAKQRGPGPEPRPQRGQREPAAGGRLPIGWLAEHTAPGRVDLGAGLVGGALPARFAEALGGLGIAITVTPWGGVVLHDLGEDEAEAVLKILAPRGFIFDANSPALREEPAG